MSPLLVARNRAARLDTPVVSLPRVYTTTTGDAPRGPSRKELAQRDALLTEVQALTAHVDSLYDCCTECALSPKDLERYQTLWFLIERIERP